MRNLSTYFLFYLRADAKDRNNPWLPKSLHTSQIDSSIGSPGASQALKTSLCYSETKTEYLGTNDKFYMGNASCGEKDPCKIFTGKLIHTVLSHFSAFIPALLCLKKSDFHNSNSFQVSGPTASSL